MHNHNFYWNYFFYIYIFYHGNYHFKLDKITDTLKKDTYDKEDHLHHHNDAKLMHQ